MVSIDCATIVAVTILAASRLPKADVLWILNRNVRYIRGDVTRFRQYHLHKIWEKIRLYDAEWYGFARGLEYDDVDPEIDRGVDRLENGCLCELRYLRDEDINYNNLMTMYERIIGPEFDDVGCYGESECNFSDDDVDNLAYDDVSWYRGPYPTELSDDSVEGLDEEEEMSM